MASTSVTVPTVSFPSHATRPSSTNGVCIGHRGKRLSAHDDAGSLKQGLLVYRTATTQKNDMTVAIDEHPGAAKSDNVKWIIHFLKLGATDREGDLVIAKHAENWQVVYKLNDTLFL